MSKERGNCKELVGVVVSDKMAKTRVVQVQRTVLHPVFKKTVRRYVKFKVHDEQNTSRTGDEVRVAQTRPLSKEKSWRLVEVVKVHKE